MINLPNVCTKQVMLVTVRNVALAGRIRKLALEVNGNLDIYVAENAATAYEVLINFAVDVFVADVRLYGDKRGDTWGVKLITQIRENSEYALTPVVFVAAKEAEERYAYSELNCVGYIQKPFHKKKVKDALETVLRHREKREREKLLFFRNENRIFPIRIRDIVYIRNSGHVVYVILRDGMKVDSYYKTFKMILYEADSVYLMQCSRSVVINKEYVFSVDMAKQEVLLKSNSDFAKIHIGVTYRKKIVNEFMH